MSGIAGIISLKESSKIQRHDVENLTDSIKYRGKDGINLIFEDKFAFVYSKLSVTNNCHQDKQPYCDESSDLIIVSNSRLDNRSHIIKEFSLKDDLPDSLIILELFKELGEDCLKHLIGPFSFVIYSKKTKEIFAARDHFGQRPFYFLKNEDFFIFSSDANSILLMPGIKTKINKLRVIDYLVFQGSIENQTFFEGINKLHRSEKLILNSSGVQITKYYSLPSIKSDIKDDEECFKSFLGIFSEVISDISNTKDNILASTCSGGLDSGGISSVLHKNKKDGQKLKSYSVHFPDLDKSDFIKTDERKYVEDFVKMYDADHTYIDSKIDPIEHLHSLIEKSYFPPKSGNGYMHQEIFDQMKKDNIRVILDGFDGDSVISHGIERLDELLRKFQISKLKSEVEEACKLNKKKFSLTYFFKNFVVLPLIPLKIRLLFNTFFKNSLAELEKYNYLTDSSKKLVNLPERFEKFYPNKAYDFKDANTSHRNGLSLPFWEEELEMIDYLSAINDVETRMPFMDLRLIEFCISIPAHLKMRSGIRRYYFRQSMREICPESILEKNTKASLQPKIRLSIEKKANILLKEISENSYLRNFLNTEHVSHLDTTNKLSGLDLSNLYKWYVLDEWIKRKNIDKSNL